MNRLSNMNNLSKVIRCEICKFAIHQKDPFTGQINYYCGKEKTFEVGGFGDEMVMMNSGCEDGEIVQMPILDKRLESNTNR